VTWRIAGTGWMIRQLPGCGSGSCPLQVVGCCWKGNRFGPFVECPSAGFCPLASTISVIWVRLPGRAANKYYISYEIHIEDLRIYGRMVLIARTWV
jgi:hypothetical protein